MENNPIIIFQFVTISENEFMCLQEDDKLDIGMMIRQEEQNAL